MRITNLPLQRVPKPSDVVLIDGGGGILKLKKQL